MEEFIYTKKLGSLYYDKIIFEGPYPILFTLIDDNKNLFLCVCHHRDTEQSNWLLTNTSPSDIISLLTNRITIRKAFLLHDEIRYSITRKPNELLIEENVYDDWCSNSSVLPDDAYLDAEDGEYNEELLYYAGFTKDNIDTLFGTLSNMEKIDVKEYIINLITGKVVNA